MWRPIGCSISKIKFLGHNVGEHIFAKEDFNLLIYHVLRVEEMGEDSFLACLVVLLPQLFPHWGYQYFLREIEATPYQHPKRFASIKGKGCNCGCHCIRCRHHYLRLDDYRCNLMQFRRGECVWCLITNGVYRRWRVDTWHPKFQLSYFSFNYVGRMQNGISFYCYWCMFILPDRLYCSCSQLFHHCQKRNFNLVVIRNYFTIKLINNISRWLWFLHQISIHVHGNGNRMGTVSLPK